MDFYNGLKERHILPAHLEMCLASSSSLTLLEFHLQRRSNQWELQIEKYLEEQPDFRKSVQLGRKLEFEIQAQQASNLSSKLCLNMLVRKLPQL